MEERNTELLDEGTQSKVCNNSEKQSSQSASWGFTFPREDEAQFSSGAALPFSLDWPDQVYPETIPKHLNNWFLSKTQTQCNSLRENVRRAWRMYQIKLFI